MQARHERCNTCFSNAIELMTCVMRIIASLIMLDRVTGSLHGLLTNIDGTLLSLLIMLVVRFYKSRRGLRGNTTKYKSSKFKKTAIRAEGEMK